MTKRAHTYFEGGLLDVEDHNLDALLREHQSPKLAEAISTSGDEDELLFPVELGFRPVI